MIREDRSQSRSQRGSNSGSLYLITGVIIGMVAGLIFSLAIAPLRYKDATPNILDVESQKIYKVLIAQTYTVEKDLGRVMSRWKAFNLSTDTFTDVTLLMSTISSQDGRSPEYQALDYLQYDLRGGSQQNPAESKPTETPEDTSQELSPTEVAMVTETPAPQEGEDVPGETGEEEEAALPEETQPPIPTSTVVAALSKPFQLEERLILCEKSAGARLQIQVTDEDGTALQGVPIQISWSTGSEVFYTGLFPAQDDGYADFDMDEDETYRVQVGQSGMIVDGLQVNTCTADEGNYPGGWWLTFQP